MLELVLLIGGMLAASAAVFSGSEEEDGAEDGEGLVENDVSVDEYHSSGSSVQEYMDVFGNEYDFSASVLNAQSDQFFPESEGINVQVEDTSSLPGPLSDWVTEPGVEVVSPQEGQPISIEYTETTHGSTLVLPANYSEEQGTSSGQELNIYTGFNLYFIPEGESFPECYKWSESGGALFNTLGLHEQEDDFGGIRLIARVDTGAFGIDVNEDGHSTITFDTRTGMPAFQSNLSLDFSQT